MCVTPVFSKPVKLVDGYIGGCLCVETTETVAVWLLRFGSHVCLTDWFKTVAIVTDADLLSVGYVALELLEDTATYICISHSKTRLKPIKPENSWFYSSRGGSYQV